MRTVMRAEAYPDEDPAGCADSIRDLGHLRISGGRMPQRM